MAQLSLRDMARATGVSDSYLSQIERGQHRPSAEVLKALADALQLSASSLYTQVGLLDEDLDSDAPTVEEAIRTDPRLSPEHKDMLLHVYRTVARNV